jgi:hypothetical protein
MKKSILTTIAAAVLAISSLGVASAAPTPAQHGLGTPIKITVTRVVTYKPTPTGNPFKAQYMATAGLQPLCMLPLGTIVNTGRVMACIRVDRPIIISVVVVINGREYDGSRDVDLDKAGLYAVTVNNGNPFSGLLGSGSWTSTTVGGKKHYSKTTHFSVIL